MSNKVRGIPRNRGRRGNAINVGHGNFVVGDRIVMVMEPGSAPMKRLREGAMDENLLVDATAGRKTRSIVITDSNHVILSALAPQTLQDRLEGTPLFRSSAQIELEEGEFVS